MGDGDNLILAMTVWLIFIPLVIVSFGHSDYHHEQARRRLGTDIPDSISIDCGATGNYQDGDTGIFYKSDEYFIDTGINKQISPGLNPKKQQKDLRSFPNGPRNCYTLKPEQGKNQNYMIKAYFMYGNYDGKNQAPVFDLYLGVNKWEKVDSYLFFEIMHFPLRRNIDVCLVNTGFGTPFISALELRRLDSSIYKVRSGALQLMWRYNLNGGQDIIRYPNDIYDRIWIPLKLPDPNWDLWSPISTESTIEIQSSNGSYYPPEQVLRTAAYPKNSSSPLSYCWRRPFNATFEYYICFHFAHIFDLWDDKLGEFNISLNGHYPLTEPIKLAYLKPLTIGPLNVPLKDGAISFDIYATEDSNLPPILNAFEIFDLNMLPDAPTDQQDVDAIMNIKRAYQMTRNWQGDPCVPCYYLWDGLNCNYNNSPRIISL
ncbi:hypothetical protein L1049_004923 [Liquidambar formosana]|uniref:Malectin-like domain-containing protein n=1 Tax=Liquidambar formosana TaxID=63359 RepID=A0AAP0RNZ5_LIQFO